MVNPFKPGLYEQPRNLPASVIPPQQNESFLEWLRNNGRLIPRTTEDYQNFDEEEEEELTEIISHDSYDFEGDEVEAVELDE